MEKPEVFERGLGETFYKKFPPEKSSFYEKASKSCNNKLAAVSKKVMEQAMGKFQWKY